MPANVTRDEPLSVGEKEAVDVLIEKIRAHYGSARFKEETQLLKAVERARDMYEGESDRFADSERNDAFLHGLLTGYSVAMVLLEQRDRPEVAEA